jgi:hypothetical protein
MNEITIKVDQGGEELTFVLENFDPAQIAGDADVWSVHVFDEEGTLQMEYFEMDSDADSLDIISEAIQTVQAGSN